MFLGRAHQAGILSSASVYGYDDEGLSPACLICQPQVSQQNPSMAIACMPAGCQEDAAAVRAGAAQQSWVAHIPVPRSLCGELEGWFRSGC